MGYNRQQAADLNNVASGTADAQGATGGNDLRLVGYSIKENNAAAAEVILRHGTADTDPIIASIKLAANASETKFLGSEGLKTPDGVFCERVSGTTVITLWTKGG